MKKFLPLLILLLTAGIVALLIFLRPEPAAVAPERPVTRVEVVEVHPETVWLSVRSEGTVLPRTESELAVEVAGRIVEMAPNFTAGGRFKEGEVLFRVDPADYEAAVAAREAELASARLVLARETALAEQAAADWSAMGEGEPSDLTLRKPQLAEAEARVASAEAALKKARRDLQRTEVAAPYDGLVLSKTVDLGQYVMANPAAPVARIYATGAAELRLPIKLEETDFLLDPSETSSPVRISRDLDGPGPSWEGRLLRFESTIDPESRLLFTVAGIDQAFDQGLRRGLFVEAEIAGREVEGAYLLPRFALRGADEVYLLTSDGTLVSRQVELLKSDEAAVVVTGGLAPGDQVATSPIAFFVENMPVEVIPTP